MFFDEFRAFQIDLTLRPEHVVFHRFGFQIQKIYWNHGHPPGGEFMGYALIGFGHISVVRSAEHNHSNLFRIAFNLFQSLPTDPLHFILHFSLDTCRL